MNRGWALVDYPQAVRRTWPEWALRQAHAAYSFRRLRDLLTVAMESEYQRRSRLARTLAGTSGLTLGSRTTGVSSRRTSSRCSGCRDE